MSPIEPGKEYKLTLRFKVDELSVVDPPIDEPVDPPIEPPIDEPVDPPPTDPPTDPPEMFGWTDFQRAGELIMVSPAGDDNRDGSNELNAVKTLARAIQLAQPGRGDHILLKCGGTWHEGINRLSDLGGGPDNLHPMLIGSYGEGPRPVITAPFSDSTSGSLANFAMVGIEFYAAERDPDHATFNPESKANGLRLLCNVNNLTIEDCLYRLWRNNITIQSYKDAKISNVKIHRSLILDNYPSPKGHCQGLFCYRIKGLTLSENVFDGNGYNDRLNRAATVFNQSAYIHECQDWTVIGNLIANRGNFGIKASSDNDTLVGDGHGTTNWTIIGNAFVGLGGGMVSIEHSNGLVDGAKFGNRNGLVNANVTSDTGRDFGQSKQAIGIWCQDSKNLVVDGNAWVHQSHGGTAPIILLRNQVTGKLYPIDGVKLQKNIALSWQFSGEPIQVGSQVKNLVNDESNNWHSTADEFTAPNRLITAQHIAEARQQRKTTWRNDRTGRALAAWVLEGLQSKN